MQRDSCLSVGEGGLAAAVSEIGVRVGAGRGLGCEMVPCLVLCFCCLFRWSTSSRGMKMLLPYKVENPYFPAAVSPDDAAYRIGVQ